MTGKIAVSGSLDFGTVARGTTATREITVTNTGLAALTISNVFRSSGDSAFTVLPNPGVPQTLQPSDSIVYTVQFAPPATSNGNLRTAVIRISSDDPDNPNVDLNASGIPGVPHGSLDTSSIDFGGVPVDNRTTPHQIDRTLTITNQSSCILCDLTITSLVFSGANPGDFSVVGAPATPFTIGAGNHIELTVRFNPPLGGARSATLTINSDDPANPSQAVSLTRRGPAAGDHGGSDDDDLRADRLRPQLRDLLRLHADRGVHQHRPGRADRRPGRLHRQPGLLGPRCLDPA